PIQANHISDAHGILGSLNPLHLIAGAHLTFFHHREVDARSSAMPEALHDVRPVETNAQLEAGHARLRNLQHGGADAKLVSDLDSLLGPTRRGQVLAKHPVWYFHVRELA